MGKPSTGAADSATLVVTGTLASVAAGSAFLAPSSGVFNLALWGTFSATLRFEKSYDGGTTWIPVSRDLTGTDATFVAPGSLQIRDTEAGNLYRVNCTAYTSGTVNYRLSY